jgi:hypothetical protein
MRLVRSCWPPSVSARTVSRAPLCGMRTVALAARGMPVSRAAWRPSTTIDTAPSTAPSGGLTRTVAARESLQPPADCGSLRTCPAVTSGSWAA